MWPYSFLTAAANSPAFAFGFFFSTRRIARLLFFLGSLRSELDNAGFLAMVTSKVELIDQIDGCALLHLPIKYSIISSIDSIDYIDIVSTSITTLAEAN